MKAKAAHVQAQTDRRERSAVAYRLIGSKALWFLQYLACTPRGISFSAADLRQRLVRHGSADPSVEVLVPEITTVIVSRKAGS
jgi:hypothetical protein